MFKLFACLEDKLVSDPIRISFIKSLEQLYCRTVGFNNECNV